MTERVAVFIDGSNFFYCLKDELQFLNLDYQAFIEELLRRVSSDARLVRVYYYDATVRQENDPERYRKQQGFLAYLRNLPHFRVELGRLEGKPGNLREKGVDIRIATDMLQYADIYDTAILVTGDGDFAYLVCAVQNKGKQVINAIGTQFQSQQLRQVCDEMIVIDRQLVESCARQDNRAR